MSAIRSTPLPVRMIRVGATVEPLTWVRWSIAVCYLWFGALKFFPGMSPAEALATSTIEALTFGLFSGKVAMVALASLECAIGVALLTRKGRNLALHLLLGHMLCTFAPVVLFPELVFTHAPFALTLVGQYIVKNLVIASAAWSIIRSPQGMH